MCRCLICLEGTGYTPEVHLGQHVAKMGGSSRKESVYVEEYNTLQSIQNNISTEKWQIGSADVLILGLQVP